MEVLTPSTRRKDLIVDTDLTEPSILVCELQDGRYVEVATVDGTEELQVQVPFPVTVRPAAPARY